MQPFVLQHQCLRFAAIAYQAAVGLEAILKKRKSTSCYSGAFHEAAKLCRDIVDNLYYTESDSINPHTLQVFNKSDTALWFYSLIRCHPKVYKGLETYEDIVAIADGLELFATDVAGARGLYTVAQIRVMKAFFVALCDAVAEEFHKEGVVGKIDFLSFHDGGKLSH
ncbi:MAG: hypothetical protein WC791_04340 [Candidatus Paceibacterota bacterium]|jgi:hypothetical protein